MRLLKQDYLSILDYYNINYNKKLPINLLRKMVEWGMIYGYLSLAECSLMTSHWMLIIVDCKYNYPSSCYSHVTFGYIRICIYI